MFITQEELYKEIAKRARDKALVDFGAKVSYHFAEAYLQCPHNIFYKNCMKAVAYALGENETVTDSLDNAVACFAPGSRDALGKALMAGIKTGHIKSAVDCYRDLIGVDTVEKMTKEQQIKHAELERELCNRVSIAVKLLATFFKADDYDTEVRFEWKASKTNIIFTGEADIITHGAHGDFLVEIKNTGNPGWIISKSGQVAYYEKLAKATGYDIAGGFYMLFPAWYDADGRVIFATAEDVQIKEGNKDLTAYWKAFDELIHKPLNVEEWPTHYGIAKCKTCACRKLCKACENLAK